MRPLPVGAAATCRRSVGAADTAQALGNPGVDVLASAICLLYAEQAARQAADPYLEPGEGLSGVRFSLRHRLPAAVGTAVLARSEVTAVRRQFITFRFQLSAEAGGALIADGEMIQAIVQLDKLSRARNKTPAEET